MKIGDFSVSLAVQDLQKSKDFYEKLGFEGYGDAEFQEVCIKKGYHIMQKDEVTIGIFEKMFDRNILTFNPWPSKGHPDVREIKKNLVEAGIELTADNAPEGKGPAHITFIDPDGNPILIDQHE